MGLSLITRLEILSNPTDLEITVSEEEITQKFCFLIFRGPGHKFKLLVSTEFIFETKTTAIQAVYALLNEIHNDLKESFSSVSFINSDASNVYLSKITENLTLKNTASTYTKKYEEIFNS